MILLHSTALSSTFGAHPHPPQRLPNLNLTGRPGNLMNSCCTSIILLCTIQIKFRLQETDVIPISWLFSWRQCCCLVPFCEGPIGG